MTNFAKEFSKERNKYARLGLIRSYDNPQLKVQALEAEEKRIEEARLQELEDLAMPDPVHKYLVLLSSVRQHFYYKDNVVDGELFWDGAWYQFPIQSGRNVSYDALFGASTLGELLEKIYEYALSVNALSHDYLCP